MKRRILTLSGMPGSGKSSTADELAHRLGYQRFSSGDFMRKVAHERALSLEELSRQAESDPSIDDAIDTEIKKTGLQEQLVIDSRLAYHWIPEAFKVYLKLDPHISAKRIYDHIHSVGRIGQSADSLETIFEKMMARIESEKKRYLEYYGIDYTDEHNFDLIVDTGTHPVQEVAEQILSTYREWEKR